MNGSLHNDLCFWHDKYFPCSTCTNKNIKKPLSSIFWGNHIPTNRHPWTSSQSNGGNFSTRTNMGVIYAAEHNTHLREGEKLCLWVVDFTGARETCRRLAAGGEYSLEGEELLPEWSAGLGERFCLWEPSEGSLGNIKSSLFNRHNKALVHFYERTFTHKIKNYP